MASPAAVLSILVKANTRDATTGLARVNQQLEATEKKSGRTVAAVGKAARATALIGGAAVAGGMVYATRKAADFEQQMSTLGAVSDASARQMNRFRRQAIKAGQDTKFSAMEAAAAQTELAKGGLSVRQIMRGGLNSALALAAAGEMDLAEAAETTVNAMKLFGLRGRDSMKVADGLATAANKTTADVSDFALSLKAGGSAAKAAGLSFIETTSVLEALAEGGIRGSDAGTSMKAMLTQLAAPTDKQQKMMRKLNLDFFDAEGKMKGVTEVSRLLQDRLKGLTEEQRLQAVKTIAGTDGMRALLALYDAGPQKMGKFQRELQKEGTAADVAKKKQDNLAGAFEQFTGTLETIGIQVGTAFLPTLRTIVEELTRFANDVSKILGRKDMDLGEKLAEIFRVATVDFGPWVDKLGDAAKDAAPKIAETLKTVGTKAASALWTGFKEAPLWAQVLGAGFVAKALLGGGSGGGFGGLASKNGSFGLAGAAAAKGFKVAFEAGAIRLSTLSGALGKVGTFFSTRGSTPANPVFVSATGIGAGGPGVAAGKPGKVGKAASVLGFVGGPAGALAITAATVAITSAVTNLKGRKESAESVRQKFTAKVEGLATADPEQFEKIATVLDKVRGKQQLNNKELKTYQGFMKEVGAAGRTDFQALLDVWSDLRGRTNRTAGATRDFRDDVLANDSVLRGYATRLSNARERLGGLRKGSDEYKTVAKQVRDLQKHINDRLIQTVPASEGARAEVKKLGVNFATLGDNVAESASYITAATNMVLSGLGAETIRFSLKAAKRLKNYGGPQGHQRGAYVNEGRSSGDSVPAVLEKGEYVLNRNAVKKVGRKALDHLNYGQAPRFQTGGIVELLHPGNDPKGHGDHLHVAMSTTAAIVALGKKLQRAGWMVGEHPAFGGVAPVHTDNSYHYRGLAIDVNWPDPSVEAAKIRALLPMLGGDMSGLGAVPKIAKQAVEGPAGMMKDILVGAEHKMRTAAQAFVDKVGPLEGAEPGMSAAGNGAGLMRAISKQRGWNFNDWWALDAAETGHGANLSNPTSTARLRGQFLDMNYGKYGPGSDPAQNPSMGEQIQSMAQYIAERYGNPTAAWAFHRAHNYYRQGGIAGLQRGSPIGSGIGGGGPDFYAQFTNPKNKQQRTSMAELIKRIRTGDTRKIRKDAMHKVIEKARGVGLPVAMQRALRTHSEAAADFGEFADRAASLTDESGITEALQAEMDRRTALGQAFPDGDQQAMVDSMLGRVGGGTQLEWLQKQLQELFHWRNAIVDAEQKIVQLREKITEAIKVAQAQLAQVRENLKHDRQRKERLEDRLKELRKKPRVNKAAIKVTKEQLRNVTKTIGVREGVRDDLSGKVLPALTGKRTALNSTRGDLLTSLDEIQGAGAPAGRWASLPAAIDATGGTIFDTRLKIADLTDKPIRVVAEAAGAGEADTESAELLKQLLREANLRTAVSQAQYKVFREMPTFATGGIVPGTGGSPRVIEAHAGEGVFTRDQMAAMGGGTGHIAVVVQDGAVDASRIKVLAGTEAERVMRSTSRRAQRGLPSRGGGLIG